MENSIILQNINAEGLKALIGEVVAEKLAALVPSQSSERYLTRKETAAKLHISLPTLNEITKKGIVTGYRIGGRVLYRESEVNTSLQRIATSKVRRQTNE